MIRVYEKEDQLEALCKTTGSYLVSQLVDTSYRDLVMIFGEPTFPESNADDRGKKEWVLEYNDRVFTIYDWNTVSEDYTMNELTTWNVGGYGSQSATDLIDIIQYEKTKHIHRAKENA